MISPPLVSIIVPVYNTEPWLRRCLDSLSMQTYQNIEILCVNDGSTDNSAKILDEYASRDSRVKVFSQKNEGQAAARNHALRCSSGEWITGVDSDDYLTEEALSQAMELRNTGAQVICMKMQLISETGDLIEDKSGYYSLPDETVLEVCPRLATQLNVCFAGKVWNGDFIRKNKITFPEGLVYEDSAFYCHSIALMKKIAFCKDPGYYYMQRRGSTMTSQVSAEVLVSRNAKIYHYLSECYKKSEINPVMSPYFVEMFYKSYEGVSNIVALENKETVRRGFYNLALEIGIIDAWPDDYRVMRMLPLTWWQRLFLRRYQNNSVVKFFGLPLLANIYKDGKLAERQLLLLSTICRKLRHCVEKVAE